MKSSVIITGAAGGIGVALCQAFKDAGYRVIGIDCRPVVAHVDVGLQVDLEAVVLDPEAAAALGRQLAEAGAEAPVGVLVNNGAYQVVQPFDRLAIREWQKTLNVNLLAPVVLSQLVFESLVATRGSIINIGSIHSSLTKPEFTAYATSKSAILGFTKALAVEAGDRIRVNAILPAAIRTPMLVEGLSGTPGALQQLERFHPSGQIGTPSEIAQLAVFVASGTVPFMNGSALSVDGGIGSRLHDPV